MLDSMLPIIHPVAVHFPIALFVVSVFAFFPMYFCAYFMPNNKLLYEKLANFSHTTFYLAAISSLVAYAFGFQSIPSVTNGAVISLIKLHFLLTTIFIISLLTMAQTIFYNYKKGRRSNPIILIVFLLLLGLMFYTGHIGGLIARRGNIPTTPTPTTTSTVTAT